jgi:hypothetical protein
MLTHTHSICFVVMSIRSLSHQEAVAFVKSRRPVVNPNFGFIRQLEMYGEAQCDMNSEAGKRMSELWQGEMDAIYGDMMKEIGQGP